MCLGCISHDTHNLVDQRIRFLPPVGGVQRHYFGDTVHFLIQLLLRQFLFGHVVYQISHQLELRAEIRHV
ncbi:hypothetical protein SDC9_177968 [bioreactor metagenome]|uniref:Uncharacterized protein n=1 Tax=bioreactor metagenome TaxID=1076179 RepID=A0A645GUS1_9ZZZZ